MDSSDVSALKHIVFDFNGTILDDIDVVAKADQEVGRRLGLWDREIDREILRTYSSREWREGYALLAGRALTDDEIALIDPLWHEIYGEHLDLFKLHDDVKLTLELLAGRGITTSILSMHPDEFLQTLVDRLGLRSYFVLVEGFRGQDTGNISKVECLQNHLKLLATTLGIDIDVLAHESAMVGDTTDDAKAAEAGAMASVIVTTGEMSADRIMQSGFNFQPSLLQAVEFLLRRGEVDR